MKQIWSIQAPITAVALAVAVPLGGQQGAGFEAEFELARAPEAVVLELDYVVDMVSEQAPMPYLQVFGDGRYVVHIPYFRKGAGSYEGRLSQVELEGLMAELVRDGVVDFDPQAVRAEMRRAERAKLAASRDASGRVEYFAVSDQVSMTLQIRLARYKPSGVLGQPGSPLERRISWTGLGWDVERHPEVAALARLYGAEARLRGLAERPGVVRLAPVEPGRVAR